MTVAELITHLQTMPQDAVVMYRCCSDWAEMDVEQVSSVSGESGRIICHHGHYMSLDKHWWPKEEKPTDPQYVTAVLFPGN